jgi:peptidyl-prolyl cis-trans isomerase C
LRNLLVCLALTVPATFALAQAAPAAAPAPVAAAPTTKPAEDPNMVVMEVGDKKITAAQFNELLDALPPQVQAMVKSDPARTRRLIGDKLAEITLLAQEARKEGVDKDPKFLAQQKLQQDQMLAQFVAEKAASGADEAALKKQYEENKANYDQVTARHILIRAKGSPAPVAPGKQELTDEQAKAKAAELRDRIVNKKEDFATLAKAESDDLGSGQRGGDLGSFGKGMMVGEFEKTAFSLKPGDVSGPVKTQFGYHLIQVQEHKTPSFDEVKEQLKGQQGPKRVEDLVARLKAENKVTLNEAYFGPAATKPAMPAMPPMPE